MSRADLRALKIKLCKTCVILSAKVVRGDWHTLPQEGRKMIQPDHLNHQHLLLSSLNLFISDGYSVSFEPLT